MNKEKLLELYPGYITVFGPYKRISDKRMHLILYDPTIPKGVKGRTITLSYPKALKEIELGRRLTIDETIDHHDRNFDNDELTNLIVKSREKHASEDAIRVKVSLVKCPICYIEFEPTRNQTARRIKKLNTAGPFCSRKCSGSYGTFVQNGGETINKTVIVKNYYRMKKEVLA